MRNFKTSILPYWRYQRKFDLIRCKKKNKKTLDFTVFWKKNYGVFYWFLLLYLDISIQIAKRYVILLIAS